MKTTLSLSALALIATALILPIQAQAADRQISVNEKKFPTLTADDSGQLGKLGDTAEAAPIDVTEDATASDDVQPTPRPKKPKTQRFEVPETADAEPVRPPKKVKPFKFEVPEQPEQAQSNPAQDEADDVAEVPTEQPSNLRNERVKLLKTPRPQITDDQQSEDIAVGTEEANDPNELRYYVLNKKKHYVQYQDEEAYQPTTYTYQEPGYNAAPCHKSYNGY
jgi:hypothetical protein